MNLYEETDRPAELIEQASQSAEFFLKVAHANRQKMPLGESRTHCEDCEEKIHPERRKRMPGCTRCVPCQDDHEKGRR